jgi:hypothetical protein
LFGAALALVVTKPLAATTVNLEAAFNGGAILIIVLNIMALMDLTSAVFEIPANRRVKT